MITLQKELQVQAQIINSSSDHISEWITSNIQTIQQDQQKVKQIIMQIIDSKDHKTMNDHFQEFKNLVRREQDTVAIRNEELDGVK